MKNLRLKLIRYLSLRFLKFITEEEVLRVVKNDLYYQGSKLNEEEKGALIAQAREFKDSPLWGYTRRNIEYLAARKLGRDAVTRDDIFIGNAMFLNLNIIEEFIEKVSKL